MYSFFRYACWAAYNIMLDQIALCPMHRITFLRTLLGSPPLLTVPPLELLASEDQDRLACT